MDRISLALKALSDPFRRAIVSSLNDLGKQSYSQLRRQIAVTSDPMFAYHLRMLRAAGLVRKMPSDEAVLSRYYRFYELTPLGMRLWLKLREVDWDQ